MVTDFKFSGTCSQLCGTIRPWQPRKPHPRPSQGSVARVSLLEADAKAASIRPPKLSTGQLSLRGSRLSRGSSTGLTLETLAEKVVDLASSLTPYEVGRWTQAVRNALPVLLGQIFTYFTISKLQARSGRCSGRVGLGRRRASQSTIQILTILRLLGTTHVQLRQHLCVCHSEPPGLQPLENLFTVFLGQNLGTSRRSTRPGSFATYSRRKSTRRSWKILGLEILLKTQCHVSLPRTLQRASSPV